MAKQRFSFKDWLIIATRPQVVKQSFIMGCVVGCILIQVNYYQAIFIWTFTKTEIMQVIFTPIVPYLVTTIVKVTTNLVWLPGQRALKTAIYQCQGCCDNGQIYQIEVKRGEILPECSHCKKDSCWYIILKLVVVR